MPRAARKSTTRSTGKKPSVTDLYKDFEKACAAARAIPSPTRSVSSRAFDQAISKCSDIATRIVMTPADSLETMLVKFRAALWCVHAPDNPAELDDWTPDELVRSDEVQALASLRDDLRRFRARLIDLNYPGYYDLTIGSRKAR